MKTNKTTTTKFMSAVLVLAMIFSALTFSAVSASPSWSYPTTAPTITWTGSGETADDPYVIDTAQELADLSYMVKSGTTYQGKYFRLTADIDLENQNWTPIGLENKEFRGYFDGNNHIVKNVTISGKTDQYQGLFGRYTAQGAAVTVKNLGVENITITTSTTPKQYRIGGIVGAGVGTAFSMENCYVKNANITCSASSKPFTMGGLAGQIYGADPNTTVTNCYVQGVTINGKSGYNPDQSGGLIGYAQDDKTTLTNCYAANVSFTGINGGHARIMKSRAKTGSANVYTDGTRINDCGINATDGTGYTFEATAAAMLTGLGNGFKADEQMVNGGFPRLSWESTLVKSNITIDSAITNGTVTASVPNPVAENIPVTLTVTPSTGYVTDWVKINGVEIAAPYNFTMPAQAVAVTASFSLYNETNGWDGSLKLPFGGEGTEASPYIIANGANLAQLSYNVQNGNPYQGKYFRLDADIDLANKNWTPIGQTNKEFKGYFDGNNHIVRNVTISGKTDSYQGLFGRFIGQSDAVSVKNLGVENITITTAKEQTSIGGIVGIGRNKFSMENCYVKNANITYSATSLKPISMGGLAGQIFSPDDDPLSVTNCYVQGVTIKSNSSNNPDRSGGLIGYVVDDKTTLTNCYAANVSFSGINGANGIITFGSAKEGSANVYTNGTRINDKGINATDGTGYNYSVTADSMLTGLGSGFKQDTYMANGGFPILTWETGGNVQLNTDNGDIILTLGNGASCTVLAAKYNTVGGGRELTDVVVKNVTAQGSTDIKALFASDIAELSGYQIMIWSDMAAIRPYFPVCTVE